MSTVQNQHQNVVNFSDLSEEEQQKYVDFFLQNKFTFNEDKSSDSYNATIKIKMNESGSNQNIQSNTKIQKQGLSTSMNDSSREKQQLLNIKENMIKENIDQINQLKQNYATKIGSKKENQNDKSETLGNRGIKQGIKVNNRYSKSPIQKKSTNIQSRNILQNITNKHQKQQNQDTETQKENNFKTNGIPQNQLSALDACMKLVQLQNNENLQNQNKIFEHSIEQSSLVETKKQQILEKLQQKLNQANKLAEMEDSQNQQSFLKDLANTSQLKNTNNIKKDNNNYISKGNKTNQKENNNQQLLNSQTVNRTRRSTSNIICKSNQQHTNKEKNNENNDENHQRARRISQDLMSKNKEYINKLQEQNKQKQIQQKRKSISPSITPRKFVQNDTQNNLIQMENNQIINPCKNYQLQPKSKQSLPTRERSNTSDNVRKGSTSPVSNNTIVERPPSTFQQIMQRQSSLINGVCDMLPNKKKNNNKIANQEKNEDLLSSCVISRSPKYQSNILNNTNPKPSQRQTVQIKRQNSKSISKLKNQTTPKNRGCQIAKKISKKQENKEEIICFEFNSFGSPCNNIEVNQVVHKNKQIDQSSNYCIKDNSLKNNPIKNNSQFSDDENEDGFKLYNIQSKRNRRQEGQLGSSQSLSSSSNTRRLSLYTQQAQNTTQINQDKGQLSCSQRNINMNHSNISDSSDNSNKIQFVNSINLRKSELNKTLEEDEYLLTEIRVFTDQSLNLRPSKMILSQVYKCIEELYQAKYYENTLMMKMSTNGNQRTKKSNGYKNEMNMQLDMQAYEISFSEFIYEYFKEKFSTSKKVSEQHLINLIVSVEYYIKNQNQYSQNQILPIQTFAAFIQNTYQKEELIFYLFAREMLLQYTQNGFESNNKILDTQTIQLTLNDCQHVLEQVYGGNEQKIIDRFMFRLSETLMEQKDPNDFNINANFFLNIVLQDYIEGKNNKIYESNKQIESFQQKQHIQVNEMCNNMREASNNLKDQRQHQNINNGYSMNSFEKWEYTFEQSFGEEQNIPSQLMNTKKYCSFSPQNDLELKIWDKMIQKIGDFIELVINDNYNEFTIKEKQMKFTTVEKIVTKKINKMMGALFDQDKERWFDLLCISRPSTIQSNNFENIMKILQNLQHKHLSEICNSEISNFCKLIIQTKELSQAIGKLLVCVLMPDNQV